MLKGQWINIVYSGKPQPIKTKHKSTIIYQVHIHLKWQPWTALYNNV